MRILVLSQYFWPETFRVNDLVEEFNNRGHEVTVLTGLPNYPDGEVFPEFIQDRQRFSSYAGSEVVRVPMLGRGKNAFSLVLNYLSFALSASFIGAFKLRGREFDAIFVFEPSPITVGIPAAVIRRLKRAPLAFWVLDLWPETLSAVGVVRSPRVLKAIGRLVGWVYRHCDLVLVQSRRFIAHVNQYIGKERICYFPSWSESTFELESASPAEEVPPAPDYFNIVFTGNIGDAQDFPAVIEAADRLRHHKVRWLIIGDGRMGAWVAEEVKRRSLESQVLLPGRFPLERMASFFKHADALLASLKDEPIFALTIPGKVQSYLAAGVPILGMLNGEGAEIIRDSGAGLTCDAGDSQGLSEAVLAMIDMTPAERADMGERGKAICAEQFAREMLIDKLEHFLEQMDYSNPPSSNCSQRINQQMGREP